MIFGMLKLGIGNRLNNHNLRKSANIGSLCHSITDNSDVRTVSVNSAPGLRQGDILQSESSTSQTE